MSTLRFSPYAWSACVALLLCSWNLNACAQDRDILHIGGGESFSETHRQAVSSGHLYLVSGEPGYLFGGVQDGSGRWHLNYLVLIKHNFTQRWMAGLVKDSKVVAEAFPGAR